MNKKKLLAMSALRATKKILELAALDELKTRKLLLHGFPYQGKGYQWGRYLRSKVQDGILHVAIFLPEPLRMGARDAAYEIYVDRAKKQFLTYDRIENRWRSAKLDYLDWPKYVSYSEGNWISRSDDKTIKQYLNGERGGFSGVLDYQLRLREESLRRRYKREVEPWDADMAQISALPKNWTQWCRKVGIPENYIFYQYSRRGATTGYCTYCEQEVPISHPRHNREGHCPRCRRKITYKALGKAKYVSTPDCYIHLVQRYQSGFVLRMFICTRSYTTDDVKKEKLYMHEFRRVLYDSQAKKAGTYCWENYKNRETRWIPQNYVYGYSYYHRYWHEDWAGAVYGKTIPALAESVLRYTGLPEAVRLLRKIDPELYLDTRRKIPMVEQLVKAGLGGLARDCMYHSRNWNVTELKSKAGLARTLGIDAQEMKRLRDCQGGMDVLAWLRCENSTGKPIPDRAIMWLCEHGLKPRDLAFLNGVMSPQQVCNYLKRQMRELNRECDYVMTTWKDYLSMAARLKMDLTSEAVYRVRNVKKRHDELLQFFHTDKSMALRAGEILKKYPHLEDIFQEIKPKYEFSDQEYTIRVPERIEEIILEGQILSHCVGDSERYWERIEQRESYILFLRRTGETDKPFYTLEIEPNGTIRQKRTLGDEQKEDILQASQFLKKWQKEIKNHLSEEDLKLAQKSKNLRVQEFEELQRDQVRVRTGKLAGSLLLDVLQADLMEAA